MLGGNKFRLRQGFAAQNAWDAGLPAVRTPKEPWDRLTNTVVSGTMSTRNGGFAIAPYLYRDYITSSTLFAVLTMKKLHLTYAGIKHNPKRQKAKLHESFAFSYTGGWKPRPTL